MDVKAFIFEATDKALKIDEAVKGVELAKEAVEAAKAAVEAAKGGVDTAKLAVVSAKEDLDAYADRAEEFGLTKSKFKDAVERMKTLLADIGAVDTAEGSDAAETKPKAARKRKNADLAAPTSAAAEQEGAAGSTEVVTDPDAESASQSADMVEVAADFVIIDEIVDVNTHGSALKAAEFGHIAATVEKTVVAASEIVEVTTDADQTPATVDASEDELDNSFAEQELIDFVDELGSTDKAVPVALNAAIRVFAWYTSNVIRQELRTSPSPLTLAGVLAAEGVEYLPASIRADYASALAHGSEKLAVAISWYNKGIELLADAKEVPNFKFSEDAKPAPATRVAPEPEAAAVNEQGAETLEEPAQSLDVVIGDIPDDAADVATIEDMDVFASDHLASADDAVASEIADAVVTETPIEETKEEKPTPAFIAKPSKPSWL